MLIYSRRLGIVKIKNNIKYIQNMCRYNKHCTAGCNKCQPLNQSNKTARFIDKALTVHGERYDYSKVNYIDVKTKVCIICPEHGEFWQSAGKHLSRRQGCPECGRIKCGIGKKKFHNRKRNWNFEQPEDYKLIPLTQGKFAMVDNEDFDKLKDINWKYSRGYGHNNILGRIHRNIIDVDDSKVVDHIDGNPLNNQKSNLRVCTQQENSMNQKLGKNSLSKYKGVTKLSEHKYLARVWKNGVVTRLGIFKCAEEAAKAYDKKALELFGEFSNLNFKNNEY